MTKTYFFVNKHFINTINILVPTLNLIRVIKYITLWADVYFH